MALILWQLIYVYRTDVRNFTYSSHLHQYFRGELLRCMDSSWLLEFCYDNKWILTIFREQSLYFVVQQINHSLNTKRILFIPVLIQGVPCVLFRFRISSWPELYRKSPSQCSTVRSLYACESVRALLYHYFIHLRPLSLNVTWMYWTTVITHAILPRFLHPQSILLNPAIKLEIIDASYTGNIWDI